MKTIPEIADDLRQHINTDNAAKRLIVEHILPIIGTDDDIADLGLRWAYHNDATVNLILETQI